MTSLARTMLGFARDSDNAWIVELDCGHSRHLRHNPPLSSYAWITDPVARSERVGQTIECDLCRQRVWPDTLERYRQTPRFDRDSVPAGLTSAHNTRAGVWARVEVETGQAVLWFEPPIAARVRIEAGASAPIPPLVRHELELDGPVTFVVSFWRRSSPG